MCKHRHTFPAIPSFNWVLLLAGSDTWSRACWEGTFQHVTILSIMSGPRPSSALASPAPCQRLFVLHADLHRFWHWTDGPELKLCMPPHCLGGGGACGCGEVLLGQKNIYHVGATVTNQWRLENMISLREECASRGTLQGSCTLYKHRAKHDGREP